MALTIEQQIAEKETLIAGKLGDVAGVTPAACNVAGLKKEIEDLQGDIVELKEQKIFDPDENPFEGTSLNLRLVGNNYMPNLTGVNQAAATLILATGKRPPTVKSGDIAVTAAGTGITVSVPGETDAVEAAKVLAAFANSKTMSVVIPDSIEATKDTKQVQADKLLADIATIAGIEEALESVKKPAEKKPAVKKVGPTIIGPNDGATEIGEVGVPVSIEFAAVGGPEATFTMDWGDGTPVGAVTSPATHTYMTAGVFTATLTATNGIAPDAVRTIEITIETN